MLNVSDRIDYLELADLRHQLLRLLDRMDDGAGRMGSHRESPSRKIVRLRDHGTIPRDIASLMFVVLNFRNRSEYEGVVPVGPAAAAVWAAWRAIESFCAGRTAPAAGH